MRGTEVASERLGHSDVGITSDLHSHVPPGCRPTLHPALTMRFGRREGSANHKRSGRKAAAELVHALLPKRIS